MTGSEIKKRLAEKDVLHNLLNGIQRLKDNDGHERCSGGEFWYLPQSVCSSGPYKSLAMYQSGVQQLNRARVTLEEMLKSLDHAIEDAHTSMYPIYLQTGIDALPNEILAMIFEFSCEGEEYTKPFELGRINKRFRQIVLGHPRLWAAVDLDRYPNNCKLALQRSRDQLLFVALSASDCEDTRRTSLLVEHASRWETCTFVSLKCPVVTSCLHKIVTCLELPRLRRFSFELGWPLNDPEEVAFFESWHAPVLSSLKLINYISRPIRGMTLSELDISLTDRAYTSWDLDTLATFLKACRTLQDLSFSISLKAYPADTLKQAIPADLPLLKRMTLKFEHDNDGFPLREFVNTFNTPNLNTLKLHISVNGRHDCDDIISDVLNRYGKWDSLTSLAVTIHRGFADCKLIFDLIITSIRLEHFFFEGPGYHICHDPPDDDNSHLLSPPLPPLETVTFKSCYQVTEEFIYDFTKRMRNARSACGILGPLKIVLIDCPNLAKIRPYKDEGIEVDWNG